MSELTNRPENHARRFPIRIDEQTFEVANPEPTGAELLALVGKSSDTHLLTLSLKGEDDQLIAPDEKVDLTKPGREQFYVVARDPLTITIDDVKYTPSKATMNGNELRHLPATPIGPERDLWLDVPGKDDRRIELAELVDLKDCMVFYTAPSTINPGGKGKQ